MLNFKKSVTAALATVTLMALAACGGGGLDPTKAHIRLVNATNGYSALALNVGSTSVASGVGYGGSADYSDADPSDTSASISNAGSSTVLSSTSIATSKDSYYTMLAYGKSGSMSSVLLDDNSGSPDSGKTLLRVINTASDAGSLDVYLTASGDALASSTALQSAAVYGTVNSFRTVTSGNWRLRVTAAGSKTDVRLDLSGLTLDSTSVKTLVLTPSHGGVLVNALVLTQQSGVSQANNTQARVRVVAGVGGAGVVSATVGSTALMTGATAPTRTDYALVTAGTKALTATSGSSSAALTSLTLTSGHDYTLLVYGSASTPVAALLEDDNTLASTSGYSKLRLVHGVNGVSGTLALKVNYLLTADSVAPGAASAYFNQSATTTARFDVSSSDGSLAAFASTGNEIVSSGVYTLFMVGDASAPVGLLAPDR